MSAETVNILMTFGFVTLGVLLSVLLEPAIKVLWGEKTQTRGLQENIFSLYKALLPAVKMIAASIVIGGISLVIALETGQNLDSFWVAILWGFSADRIVTMFAKKHNPTGFSR